LIKNYVIKTYGGVDVLIHLFDVGTRWNLMISFTPPPLFPREIASGTHWLRRYVGPRTGMDDMERRKILPLQGLEVQPLGRPVQRGRSVNICHDSRELIFTGRK
jgi:hypothetical protein